uniref:Uncharacterized protein n=1 Tax=Aegilops tauschii subsp. strangulata TaxID=200361 RepID=A0A453IM42_AEGTS
IRTDTPSLARCPPRDPVGCLDSVGAGAWLSREEYSTPLGITSDYRPLNYSRLGSPQPSRCAASRSSRRRRAAQIHRRTSVRHVVAARDWIRGNSSSTPASGGI